MSDNATKQEVGPGAGLVSAGGITGILSYVTVMSVLVFYMMIKLWPYPTPGMGPPSDRAVVDSLARSAVVPADTSSDNGSVQDTSAQAATTPADSAAAASGVDALPVWLECRPQLAAYYHSLAEQHRGSIPKCVYLFGQKLSVWDEQRLLFLVMLAGALGGLVHGLRSLTMYVGHRELRWSWTGYYLIMPFAGAAIATVFYLVIRGGFFSPTSDFSETSPFGFTAFAAIVGLFSQHAVLKLQKIAETVFEPTPPGKDALAGGGDAPLPALAKVALTSASAGAREDVLEIQGSNFVKGSQLEINGKARTPEFVSDKLLRVTLEAAELAIVENGGQLRVVVMNPGGKKSTELEL
ncbi:MAG: hypothetical protein ACRENP_15090 [Longimicrobiales bacterium]